MATVATLPRWWARLLLGWVAADAQSRLDMLLTKTRFFGCSDLFGRFAFLLQQLKRVGPGTQEGQIQSRVDPPSFGINYGSVSFGQLSGYIVFCILLIWGASPPV